MVRPPFASLLEPRSSGWFDLSGPVGMRFASARDDAIRLEGILANSGDLDLSERGGPTGYWGLAQDKALRGYQRRNGLAVDGWAGPGGETVAHMRDAFGPLLGGYGVPTPEDVDAHHDDIAAGGPGLIALVPRVPMAPIPGLPDIGAAGRASNAAQIDWLGGNRTGFAGVPAQLARYVREQGELGLAQAHDFLGQFGRRRPGEADGLLAAILGAMPEADLRARLLGVEPGALPPVGVRTTELRNDEREPGPEAYVKPVHRWADDDRPGIRLLAADERSGDAGGDPRTEPAPTAPAPDYDKPPAYRAEVFAAQPGVWDAMRDAVKGDPALGEGQRSAYMAIFAGEGGMRRDRSDSAVAGITQGFIDGERRNGTWPAGLDHVKTPADLKPEDVKPAYRHYFDQAFAKIGGAKVLDDIGDPKVAAAIADTLFRSGPGKGAEMVQDAVNDAGLTKIDADGVFGSRTLDAIKGVVKSDVGVQTFLEELANRRKLAGFESETPRFDFLRNR
jgi:hypothetical protein